MKSHTIYLKNKVGFVKYIFGGFISSLSDLLIFTFLINFTNLNYIISNSISFTFAVIVAFFYHRHITFNNYKRNCLIIELSIFSILSIFSLIISNIILFILISYLGLIPFIAKCLQIFISLPINYTLNKKIVFKD